MRTLIGDLGKPDDRDVELCGWVRARRDHGKLVFIDLGDRSGLVQVVFPPAVPGAGDLRLQYVVRVRGIVRPRPAGMTNDKLPNGTIEVQARSLDVLNPAEELPLPVDDDGYAITEEVRLTYRYLDLRRARLAKNLERRHRIVKFVRDWLDARGFLEIETPILSKSTPEGARDYLVPSRVSPGNFYALPQSPQQYKQLLMTAGVERYFQIARCFRDEDTRGDRQPEFTQLDLEMSFVEREDVMAVNEELLIAIVRQLYPEKRLQKAPFPRMSCAEAMAEYRTDRPDLRKDKTDPDELAFCWIIDFPFFEEDKEVGLPAPRGSDGAKKWTFTHNPFSAPKPEYMDDLLAGKNVPGILTTQYDVVLNGFEIGGGSIRNHRPEALRAVFKIMGLSEKRIEENFGHMLKALALGTPPHGGIAWGLDRLVAVLQNEPNIREVIPFAKTGDGRDPMMGSPGPVEKKQLEELGLKVAERRPPRRRAGESGNATSRT